MASVISKMSWLLESIAFNVIIITSIIGIIGIIRMECESLKETTTSISFCVVRNRVLALSENTLIWNKHCHSI